MRTLIAIPCMDTMPVGFVQSLMYLEKGEGVSVCFKANSLVYDSRNLLSLTAIQEGFDRIMWLDSDMMFQTDTLKRLQADLNRPNGGDMVTGMYVKRRYPILPVVYDELDEPTMDDKGNVIKRIHEYVDYPKNSIFPIKGCGFGCCLMNVSMMKDVWDHFGPAFTPYPWAGEDISFCHRVNQLGYQIYCDSNIQCGHIGKFVYSGENLGRGDVD